MSREITHRIVAQIWVALNIDHGSHMCVMVSEVVQLNEIRIRLNHYATTNSIEIRENCDTIQLIIVHDLQVASNGRDAVKTCESRQIGVVINPQSTSDGRDAVETCERRQLVVVTDPQGASDGREGAVVTDRQGASHGRDAIET